MFLSSSCAVLTSLETTNACTGCCVCSPIASASWFVTLAPTTLNAGACGDASPPLPLGDILAAPDGDCGLVDWIDFTDCIPVAKTVAILPILDIVANGSGKVVIDGLNYPTSDGSSGQFLKTDGAGNLSYGATEIQTDTNAFLGGNLNLNDNNILVTTNNTSNIGHANNQLATVFTNNIHMHNAYHSHASTATSSSTTEFAADSFAIATYRSAEYFISAQDASANKFHTEKIMVLHDGTDNFMTTFATLISDNTLFTVTSDINSGNVRLLITPTTSNSLTYRFIAEKHLI